MAVEPQRTSHKDCVELGFGLLATTSRNAPGIQAEIGLRIVWREPQCAFK